MGNVCCEPRSYGGWTPSTTRNIIFLPKPVRTDYDQVSYILFDCLTKLDHLSFLIKDVSYSRNWSFYALSFQNRGKKCLS